MLDDFMMFLHDFISHPLMAIIRALGFPRAGKVVHDMTLPESLEGAFIIEGDEFIIRNISMEEDMIGMLFSEVYSKSKGQVSVEKIDGSWIVKAKGYECQDASLEMALAESLDLLTR